MTLVIQATTTSGQIIEGARWEIDHPCSFQKGQKVSVEFPVKDPNLVGYISKTGTNECMIDGERENFSIIMLCVVNEVRHMVKIADKLVDTMVIVMASNRTVESVLQYILTPSRCDPRFAKAVRGD